jgi:ubiquinone/menaquinone biosynthesis C-methylase UbiE
MLAKRRVGASTRGFLQSADRDTLTRTMSEKKQVSGYLHGFTEEEQARLRRQARFLEYKVHDQLPFRRSRRLLEVGCGVGAQTEILLRHFPEIHVTGIDASPPNLAAAKAHLESLPWAKGRFDLVLANAERLQFDAETFDAAFLCWILEHVGNPTQILSEVRRVLRPGSPIVVNEVQNATFFIDPYSPNTQAFWMALNDHQLELGGDPFIGAKLGNLLQAVGYRDITTKVRTFHLDSRHGGERAEFLAYWTELLLSAAPGLIDSGKVKPETVEAMKEELKEVAHNPNAVFFYSFVQARAKAW